MTSAVVHAPRSTTRERAEQAEALRRMDWRDRPDQRWLARIPTSTHAGVIRVGGCTRRPTPPPTLPRMHPITVRTLYGTWARMICRGGRPMKDAGLVAVALVSASAVLSLHTSTLLLTILLPETRRHCESSAACFRHVRPREYAVANPG